MYSCKIKVLSYLKCYLNKWVLPQPEICPKLPGDGNSVNFTSYFNQNLIWNSIQKFQNQTAGGKESNLQVIKTWQRGNMKNENKNKNGYKIFIAIPWKKNFMNIKRELIL